jgi:hypothetical protein
MEGDFFAIGIDPSLRGLAAVCQLVSYKDNKYVKTPLFNFIVTVKNKSTDNIDWGGLEGETDHFILPSNKGYDCPTNFDIVRLSTLQYNFSNWLAYVYENPLLPITNMFFCAIEGYSMGSRNTNSIFQLGELGGNIKYYAILLSSYLRSYSPKTVKKYCSGSGSASKRLMVESARRNGFVVPEESIKNDSKKLKKPIDIDGILYDKDITGPGCDLCDAFHISNMLADEVLFKRKVKNIEDADKTQQEVMFSTSKTVPVCILDQKFVVLDGPLNFRDVVPVKEIDICG